MSLINEALKKAQRMRHEAQAADAAPIAGGGAPIAKRKQARSANTMVLIASGAVVLIVLSVVITVWLVNRPSAPARPAPATTATPKATISPGETTAPAIVPPKIAVPATNVADDPAKPSAGSDKATPAATITPAPATTATTAAPVTTAPMSNPANAPATPAAHSASTAASVAANSNGPVAAPAPASAASPALTTSPAPLQPAAAPEPAKADERVAAFVEAIRVTGIRSSGTDSRVLMNERVFRVNDIVDRTLGVRLVKVASDSLTFSDANGVLYVKYF